MLQKRYINPKLNKRKIQNEVEDQEEDEKRSRLKRTRRRPTLIDIEAEESEEEYPSRVILQVYSMILMMMDMI